MLTKDTRNYLSFFACTCDFGLLVEKTVIQVTVCEIYPRLVRRILIE